MSKEYLPLAQTCPVCSFHLEVTHGYKEKSGNPFFMVVCEMNAVHFKAFINKWPHSWETIPFAKWSFSPDADACPICGGALRGYISFTKRNKPCQHLECASNGAHFHAFLNSPDEITWSNLKIEQNQDNAHHIRA